MTKLGTVPAALAIFAAVLVPGSASSAGTFACGDGAGMTFNYGSQRQFVDAQGWWKNTDPADATNPTFNTGHVHVGACIPDHEAVSGTWVLHIKVQMHDHQGSFGRLNVTAKGNGYELDISPKAPGGSGYTADQAYLDPQMTVHAPTGTWNASGYGTTDVRYFKVPMDSSLFPHSGIQEVRFRAFTNHPQAASGRTEDFTASMNFRVFVNNANSRSDYGREPYVRGKGIYTDKGAAQPIDDKTYCEADFAGLNPAAASLVADNLPDGPVSGIWRPYVAMVDHDTANDDNVVTHWRWSIDPKFHAVPTPDPGTQIHEGNGPLPAQAQPVIGEPDFTQIAVDTTVLSAGVHILHLRADCLNTKMPGGNRSTQSGVIAVPFTVS